MKATATKKTKIEELTAGQNFKFKNNETVYTFLHELPLITDSKGRTGRTYYAVLNTSTGEEGACTDRKDTQWVTLVN